MGRIGIGLSDVGKVRDNNEDSLFISNSPLGRLQNVYIVADGMGGHKAGEIASRKAIEFFVEYVEKRSSDKYTEHFLADAVRYANGEVYAMSLSDDTLGGMGTTFTVCCADNVNLYYAHVGDSRAYIVNAGEIKQITEDHTYVEELVKAGEITKEEARVHPNRNVITRALGTEADTPVDCGYTPITGEDAILICSDGLTGMLTDEEIFGIVSGGGDITETAKKLIDSANGAGGADNVTVILA